MKKLLEFIINSLVDKPEAVVIEEVETEDLTTFQIKLDSADIGKVIGKEGRIIKSIRTLLKTKALKENRKIQLVIAE